LAVIVGIGFPLAVFVSVIGAPEPQQFLVPGVLDYPVKKPGEYVLWDNYETIFQGRTYSLPVELPAGVVIKLVSPETKAEIPMATYLSTRAESRNSKRRSIGKFSIAKGGSYQLSVAGSFPQRVFSLGPDEIRPLLVGTLISASATMLGLLGSAALAVSVFLRRHKARKLAPTHVNRTI
jgi:hypothetical protein